MPTKKKRVGFIPRDDVMKIINELSIENNLSNSKIISILVEEALSIRGMLNKKNAKLTQSFQRISDNSKQLYEVTADFKDNEKLTINAELENLINSGKNKLLKQINQVEFDLQTYKKYILFLKFQEMVDEYKT